MSDSTDIDIYRPPFLATVMYTVVLTSPCASICLGYLASSFHKIQITKFISWHCFLPTTWLNDPQRVLMVGRDKKGHFIVRIRKGKDSRWQWESERPSLYCTCGKMESEGISERDEERSEEKHQVLQNFTKAWRYPFPSWKESSFSGKWNGN